MLRSRRLSSDEESGACMVGRLYISGRPTAAPHGQRRRSRYNSCTRNQMAAEMQMTQSRDNPMGTDGFEFVEYTAPDPQLLRTLFERMGFPVKAQHRSKNVTLHGQGGINFIINAEPASFAQQFARAARPLRLRDGLPREGCGLCLSPCARARRQARSAERGPDGAQHPLHRRHWRLAHLPGRSLRRPLDLRR